MSVPGAVSLKVLSPQNNDGPKSWTLPCWVLGGVSFSVSAALGPGVWISQRLANELKIHQDDLVTFEFVADPSKTFQHKVGIMKESIPCDVVIHGGIHLGILKGESNSYQCNKLIFPNGDAIETQFQNMWVGMGIAEKPHGKGVLYFHGSTTENGDASYGFYLETSAGQYLIRGHGYYSNKAGNYSKEDMAYKALFDGLTWTSRIPFQKLEIHGDSESVIQACQSSLAGSSTEVLKRIRALVHPGTTRDKGLKKIIWKVVSPTDNGWAVKLARLAVENKAHDTSCDWENINNRNKRKHEKLPEKSEGISPAAKAIGLLVLLCIILVLARQFLVQEIKPATVPASFVPPIDESGAKVKDDVLPLEENVVDIKEDIASASFEVPRGNGDEGQPEDTVDEAEFIKGEEEEMNSQKADEL